MINFDFIAVKSSNEIGRLAAGLVQHSDWIDDNFDKTDFKVKYVE